MSGTAFKCGVCDGMGVLLIDISPDGETQSHIEKPCTRCNGKGILTKAQLIEGPADVNLKADELLPIPIVGGFKVYVEGKTYQRKLSARLMYKLASYFLDAAIDTEAYEKGLELMNEG